MKNSARLLDRVLFTLSLAMLASPALLSLSGCASPDDGLATDDIAVEQSAVTTSGFTKINCGGSAVGTFVADADSSGGSTKSRTDLVDVGNVTNPAPMAVYQSQRYGNMTYTLPGFTPSSANLVRLHFADTHWSTPGQRSFNVTINGVQVLTGFDVVAAAGAIDTAIVEGFTIAANTAGAYVIQFTTVKDAATISGIEVVALNAAQERSWLQFGGDSSHTGNNALETHLGTQNYKQLKALAGFTAFPPSAAPPVILAGVTLPAYGVTDLAFVNNHGKLQGFDARTGALRWGPAAYPTGSTGAEASPAIDPSLLYVYNTGADECVHKYDVITGYEYVGAGAGTPTSSTTQPTCLTNGWPERWQTAGTSLGSEYAKTSLTIGISGANKYLYVGTCNGSGYYGHVTTINLTTGAQKTSPGVSGTWARAGVSYDAQTQKVYVPTVDGNFTPPTSWGYTVLGLAADGSSVVDSFTPSPLLSNDWDLGSTNMLVLRMSTSFPGPYPHLGVQSGKDGYLRLVNLDNMSNQGGSGHLGTTDPTLQALGTTLLPTIPAGTVCQETSGPCPITSPISTWYSASQDTSWVFVNGPLGMNALELIVPPNGHVYLSPQWTAPTAQATPGGSTVANAVLYYANPNGLYACPAVGPASSCFRVGTGSQSGSHQTPAVVNGVLYFNGAAYTVP